MIVTMNNEHNSSDESDNSNNVSLTESGQGARDARRSAEYLSLFDVNTRLNVLQCIGFFERRI